MVDYRKGVGVRHVSTDRLLQKGVWTVQHRRQLAQMAMDIVAVVQGNSGDKAAQLSEPLPHEAPRH